MKNEFKSYPFTGGTVYLTAQQMLTLLMVTRCCSGNETDSARVYTDEVMAIMEQNIPDHIQLKVIEAADKDYSFFDHEVGDEMCMVVNSKTIIDNALKQPKEYVYVDGFRYKLSPED